MDVNNLIEQGISAIQANDKIAAVDVLEQAVTEDPNNAKAWYLLAGAYTDLDKRRYALETVLDIDPDHEQAKTQLASLSSAPDDAPEYADFEVIETQAVTDDSSGYDAQTIREEEAMFDDVQSSSNPTQSTSSNLPVNIPGQPEVVTPQNVIELFVAIVKNGISILQRKPGVYAAEVQNANWWRFWVFLVGVTLVTATTSTISSLIIQGQVASQVGETELATSFPPLFTVFFTFIIAIPVGIAVTYAGLYASHRFAAGNRNGQGSLVTHAYAIMLPVTTASLIASVINFVFTLLPLGGLVSLVTFAISIYGWYIAHGGIRMVHKIESNSAVWTLVVFVFVQIIAAIVLGLVLSPILLAAGMMSFM